MGRIAVLTSGGDAPGMNACIRAVVRYAARHGLDVSGFRRGFCGLIEGDSVELDARSVANIIHRGGTLLETGRSKEMKTPAGIAKAVGTLERRGIDGLITLGGDGTFRGASALADAGGTRVIGIPCTIDNDVYGTDYAVGFDTAVNTALEAIDRIRDSCQSLQRPFFVEVMGRSRGFIALDVGMAGGAEDILIPETETDVERLCRDIKASFERGKKCLIIVVAEGDEAGGVFRVADQVWQRLNLDYRVCVLGHIQRGGSPTARDRILAGKLGAAAVDAFMNGMTRQMVGELKGELALTPLSDSWTRQKQLDSNLIDLIKVLAS